MRLFCFPYGGGGPEIYRLWPDNLPPSVEVAAVHLPGRGVRLREHPFTQISLLIDVLTKALHPHLDSPYVFFGHSMGALIAFELARNLRRMGVPSPSTLIVSGFRAPQIVASREPIHSLPHEAFIDELRKLNGTPNEVFQHPELLELVLPILRADFELWETYSYYEEPPLDCPIAAYGGLSDTEIAPTHLDAWRYQTSAAFTRRMFVGDHFYINSCNAELFSGLTADVGLA